MTSWILRCNAHIAAILLQLFVSVVQGTICGEEECSDVSIFRKSYCCGFNSKRCCFSMNYTPAWYIAFGVIVMLMILYCVVKYHCCHEMNGHNGERQRLLPPPGNSLGPTQTQEVQVQASSQPPSYEEVKKQGIPPEFQVYSEMYQEENG